MVAASPQIVAHCSRLSIGVATGPVDSFFGGMFAPSAGWVTATGRA